jgi:mannose-6-phosphate isomerase-like protein (cupin superfamily)
MVLIMMMNINPNITTPKIVTKNWGYEMWIHNDEEYCGKLLVFNKEGDKFSMHYHLKKRETWFVQSGSFIFKWIDTENGLIQSKELISGESVCIERGLPHQLIALENNSTIFEVSTQHFDEDSYRIYRDSPNDLID